MSGEVIPVRGQEYLTKARRVVKVESIEHHGRSSRDRMVMHVGYDTSRGFGNGGPIYETWTGRQFASRVLMKREMIR